MTILPAATSAVPCLVVDDDREIRESLAAYLRGFRFDVRTAASGAEMRRLMLGWSPEVVVLDLMLPDEHGLDLCRWLKGSSSAAVVMLTAQGDTTSRIVGLELGADDYLGKPFEPRELVARLNAVLRRGAERARGEGAGSATASPATPAEAAFAGWRFDRVARHLTSPEGVLSPLSSAEFRLLTAFVDHPGRLLTREQLLDLTRAPGVEVNDRSIDLAVSRLRQKLGDDARSGRLIRTVRGEGYVFQAER